MSPQPLRTPRTPSRKRMWALIAIAAFLLVDVALVAWALTTTRANAPSTPGPIPTFTNRPATPTATPTPAPTAPPTPAVAAAPRLLAVVSATEAYRATPGACTGGDAANTVFEKSTDAGATWQAFATGQYNFHTMLALSDATDTRISAVVGAGANCAIGAYSSFTGGQFWQEYPQNLAAASYIDPADRSKIHTSAGAEAAPCPAALQLASGANSTAVLCDGTVFTRAGSGTWASAPVPGVLALTASDSGYTLAVANVAGCAGVSIQSLPVGGSPTVVGCDAAATAPTAATVAQQGQSLWLWTGTTVAVSANAGATW